jgi:aminomethyltransferase
VGWGGLGGPRAAEVVHHVATNDVVGAPVGKAVYTLLCRPDGGIVDDCIFYKRAEDDYYVIVNASNTEKDIAWMREQAAGRVEVEDLSDATGLIAVQGPKAAAMVDALAGGGLLGLPTFSFTDATIAGVPVMAARTGYTGEDGFELAIPAAQTAAVWAALLEAAEPLGGLPIGLGARDTLRLEAKLPLYGNDIDATTNPLEAGLGWTGRSRATATRSSTAAAATTR